MIARILRIICCKLIVVAFSQFLFQKSCFLLICVVVVEYEVSGNVMSVSERQRGQADETVGGTSEGNDVEAEQ